MRTADVIVIGAGMAGLSVAASVAEHSKVLVLETERHTGYHSTSRSAAMMIQNYGSDVLRRLNRRSYQLYKRLEIELEQTLLHTRGELIVAANEEAEKLEDYLQMSAGLVELDTRQAIQLCPALRREAVARVAHEPEAADIDVDLLLQYYIRRLKSFSGEIFLESKVTTLVNRHQCWQVDTASGRFSAPLIINAAGAWSDQVAASANLEPVGMMPLKRSAAVIKADGYDDVDRWPLVLGISENWYAKPQSGMLIVSPADEQAVEPHDAWPEDIVLAEGLHRLGQFMDISVRRIESSWAGLRTFARDRNPVVGFSEQSEGFFWLAGQGGYGIQTAPVLAKLACDMIMGEADQWPSDLVAALAPGRKM